MEKIEVELPDLALIIDALATAAAVVDWDSLDRTQWEHIDDKSADLTELHSRLQHQYNILNEDA